MAVETVAVALEKAVMVADPRDRRVAVDASVVRRMDVGVVVGFAGVKDVRLDVGVEGVAVGQLVDAVVVALVDAVAVVFVEGGQDETALRVVVAVEEEQFAVVLVVLAQAARGGA